MSLWGYRIGSTRSRSGGSEAVDPVLVHARARVGVDVRDGAALVAAGSRPATAHDEGEQHGERTAAHEDVTDHRQVHGVDAVPDGEGQDRADDQQEDSEPLSGLSRQSNPPFVRVTSIDP